MTVRDADQIALILQLKEYGDLGNKYSDEWIGFAIQRLSTDAGQKLADKIIQTDSSSWWFKEKSDWWVNGSNK
jgi:putative hydrolase of HD superfamily